MRRGIRGKSKNNNYSPASRLPRPPGLKGKEIGFYYRNIIRQRNMIKLRIPETAVSTLLDSIKTIEQIAIREGIYLEPVQELKFVKPNTDGADFIPLEANEHKKELHHITNIIRKDDDVIYVSKKKKNVDDVDDVIYVKSGQLKPVSISDDEINHDSKLMDMEYDVKPTAHKKARANATMLHSIDNDEKPSNNIKLKKDISNTFTDSDSKTYKRNKDTIEPVAGCSNTQLKNKSFDDNNENSKSEIITFFEGLKASKYDRKSLSELEKGNTTGAKTEHVAGGSSTQQNDVMLLDSDDEDINPSTSVKKPFFKPGKNTFQTNFKGANLRPMSEKKTKGPEAKRSNTKFNDDMLLSNVIDTPTTSNIPIKPFLNKMKGRKQPVARSSTQSNDVIVLDDNDDVKPVTEHNTTESQASNPKKDYKYGYNDIITGSFEDKLDESLAKGVEILIENETTRKLSEALLEEFNIIECKPKYKKIREFRKTLPTYKMAEKLLDVVNNNQVIVISGETGCGKSTQVPQIILDDALKNKRGANIKILVTEPRRIAASSLATRVADERAESMGKSVGYSVRLERVECRQRGSIMYCTTGVLLVELEVNQCLSNYTHIILDEVHERDCQIDISMCMLRQVLKKRKDLKLILMSATIDSASLSSYYDNCPMLHIEGLAFPVKDVYLEEILHMTRYRPPPTNNNASRGKVEKPWKKHLKKKQYEGPTEMEKEILYRAEIGPWLESVKKTIDRDVYLTLQDPRIEELDLNLIFQLLLCITRSDPGSILVFLPGIGDTTKLIKIMQESHQFPENLFDIHPLHSKLPTLTQQKIFIRPPGNVRKIIIATNVAETSITIDDIVYVVDCAKVKYKGLSVKEHLSTLKTEWASQANLRQRRGRAGRCQPGICYHLVTSYRAGKLEERLLPELLRDDLLEPVLQIKRLRLGVAELALCKMPSVPHWKTIKNAIKHLQQCGALDENETLTPLGWHMARLPVHPAAGKLLLLGALFGCLDRAASVAAVWGFKDPFNLVIGKERQVDEAKHNLALGEPSDHIAISEAIIQWESLDYYNRNQFAREYFLSRSTLELLSEMKKQFGSNLKQMGFLKSGSIKSIWENRNANNLALFKAIVAASLYPNIGCVSWRNLHNRKAHKQPSIIVKTCDGSKVQVHPSSVMSSRYDRNNLPICSKPGANWLVYWLKQRSTELFIIEVTLVYTLPLLFFGELKVTQGETRDDCSIYINSVKVCCNKESALLLFRLRSLLDQVLASKIMAAEGKRSSIFEEEVLDGVINLITAEDARTEYLDGSDSENYDTATWN